MTATNTTSAHIAPVSFLQKLTCKNTYACFVDNKQNHEYNYRKYLVE